MKKTIAAAAALLAAVCTCFSGCTSMNTTGRINRGRIAAETTTESKLREDAGKIRDDMSEAASDAGAKVKEKVSEAGSTVREGMEDASEELSRMSGGNKKR